MPSLYRPDESSSPAEQPAPEWWSVSELRIWLPAGTVLGYWIGPNPAKPAAAFLAVTPDRNIVHSVVRLGTAMAFQHDGHIVTANGKDLQRVESLDLIGMTAGEHTVLFHTEPQMARTAVSFDTGPGTQEQRFIVTGLAPGTWEIWRNGWNIESLSVNPSEGVLYFEGRRGSYFLRRLT